MSLPHTMTLPHTTMLPQAMTLPHNMTLPHTHYDTPTPTHCDTSTHCECTYPYRSLKLSTSFFLSLFLFCLKKQTWCQDHHPVNRDSEEGKPATNCSLNQPPSAAAKNNNCIKPKLCTHVPLLRKLRAHTQSLLKCFLLSLAFKKKIKKKNLFFFLLFVVVAFLMSFYFLNQHMELILQSVGWFYMGWFWVSFWVSFCFRLVSFFNFSFSTAFPFSYPVLQQSLKQYCLQSLPSTGPRSGSPACP